MADLKQDFGTASSDISGTTLDSLATDSYSAASSSHDFGDPAPFAAVIEAKVVSTSTGTADGPILAYALWSDDDTDFSDVPSANKNNAELIGVVDIYSVTTETTHKKVWQIPVRAQYMKLVFFNDTGQTLKSADHTVIVTPVTVNSA